MIKDFSTVYKEKIYEVFGSEFYKHALVLNSIMICFCFILCLYISKLKLKTDLYTNEISSIAGQVQSIKNHNGLDRKYST